MSDTDLDRLITDVICHNPGVRFQEIFNAVNLGKHKIEKSLERLQSRGDIKSYNVDSHTFYIKSDQISYEKLMKMLNGHLSDAILTFKDIKKEISEYPYDVKVDILYNLDSYLRAVNQSVKRFKDESGAHI